MIKNNADMYRLWRHLYETREYGDRFWIHGFRTDARNRYVSLDDYNGKNSKNSSDSL